MLDLTPERKQDLERWGQPPTLARREAVRARLIFTLATGQNYREIENGMQTSAATIARCKTRLEQERLAHWRRVQQKPNDGIRHWSRRKLAAPLGEKPSQSRLKPTA